MKRVGESLWFVRKRCAIKMSKSSLEGQRDPLALEHFVLWTGIQQ